MTKPTAPVSYPSNHHVSRQSPQPPRPASGRNLSLDLLKALAILLVIFYHNGQLNPDSIADNLLMTLPNAAVPCFFMASGAVFFHRPFDMKKHLGRMLRFYLVVAGWKLIYLALYRHWGAPAEGSVRALLSYLLLFQHLEGVGTAHFWFMDAMLTVMLAAPVLYLCFNIRDDGTAPFAGPGRKLCQASSFRAFGGRVTLPGHSQLLLFLLAALVLFNQLPAVGNLALRIVSQITGQPEWNISPLGEVNPFSFRYSNYFTYYLLGGLLMEYRERFSVKTAAALALAGSMGLFCIKYIQTGSFRWNGIYLESGYYWFSTMLLAAGLFLLTIRLHIREHSLAACVANWVGASTMGIFYLHIPLIFVLAPAVFTRLLPYNGWLVNLAESCLVILLSLPIIWAGRKIPVIRSLFG